MESLLKHKGLLIYVSIGVLAFLLGIGEWFITKSNNSENDKIKETYSIKENINTNKDIKIDKSVSSYSAISSPDTLISVDVSGAVASPGVYDLNAKDRIIDAIDKAGGISTKSADVAWVSRNLNLASKIIDGEKIYIPFKTDTKLATVQPIVYVVPSTANAIPLPTLSGQTSGVLGVQTVATVVPSAPPNSPVQPTTAQVQTDQKISINTASKKDLDTLPGVGEVTAQKIIDGRNYTKIEDLRDKKIVNNSTYEKIKDKIKI